MTVGEWLATRAPAPPPQLMRRVHEALEHALDHDARLAADRCLTAAEGLLAQLLRDGRTGRESAADLLAADALVTYAFEAASDDPAGLDERARHAMVRLARLGADHPAAARGSSVRGASPSPG
jgi:uncharacterized membrane protein